MNLNPRVFFVFCFLLVIIIAERTRASHLRAGEIIAVKRSTFQYDFTLVLYRNTIDAADQLTATLVFGDGDSATVNLNSREQLNQNTQKLTFLFSHTYRGAGNYLVRFTERFRNSGIVNINNGGSGNTNFYVETLVSIDPLLGSNTSPTFLAPPIDKGNLNQTYYHSPAAWDPDGDSLSYELITPQSNRGVNVPNYRSPDDVPTNNADYSITMDASTGLITWNRPIQQGLYNIAFKVSEYRNGSLIGYVVRDMQIEIVFNENKPPQLFIPKDTCLTAGLLLRDTIYATDSPFSSLRITGYSGIFNLGRTDAANAIGSQAICNPCDRLVLPFEWQTSCSLIRSQPYQITYRAEDNPGLSNSFVDIKVWSIKIIPPEFKNLQAKPVGRSMVLTWDAYSCNNVDSVVILRKQCGTDELPQDSCSTGNIAPIGYTFVKRLAKSATTFTDDNRGQGLEYETQYCYYVYAEFPPPQKGFSRASAVACASLVPNVPLLLKASVITTDSINGRVALEWTRPKNIDVNTSPPPYRLLVYKIENNTKTYISEQNIADTTAFGDTTFVSTSLNTKANNLTYGIEYFSQGNMIYNGSVATTVKLSGVARSRGVTLSWTATTPWNNDTTYIYKVTNGDTLASATVVGTNAFTDRPLIANVPYTYLVETSGQLGCNRELGTSRIKFPLKNRSQIITVVPTEVDTLNPCPPVLSIINDPNCEDEINPNNLLYWQPTLRPTCDSAVVGYKLYNRNDEGIFVFYIDRTDTSFSGAPSKPVSGCFYVTAVDIDGSESEPSNVVCSDSCFYFELPNMFTPNGDGINDAFTPKPFPRNVEKVVFRAFNRWGGEVYRSENDIEINWMATEQPVGLYYYQAEVTISTTKQKRRLKGWVLLER